MTDDPPGHSSTEAFHTVTLIYKEEGNEPPWSINHRGHSQAPVASQHKKTNKVVWTCEDYWPPQRNSTYKRHFTQEGNYLVFASCLFVTVSNFLSIGVSSCLGWYAGIFVNPSLILSILFKKKSAKSSASWLLVVPVGIGFSLMFPSMPFNALNNC